MAAELTEAERTMTVVEAAAFLGKPERTVRRYAANGKLAAERVAGAGGREEWRIHLRDVVQMPNVAARSSRDDGRSKEQMTVPADLFREAQTKLEAALLQVGQLTEVRTRLELTEKTESTLRAELDEARERIRQLENRRRSWWFRARNHHAKKSPNF
jgi:excisionase family DNA binding protein